MFKAGDIVEWNNSIYKVLKMLDDGRGIVEDVTPDPDTGVTSHEITTGFNFNLGEPAILITPAVIIMKIEGIEIDIDKNYLDPVTYVPYHAKGNAQHPDAEIGVIVNIKMGGVIVLFCKSRTTQCVQPKDLVWG